MIGYHRSRKPVVSGPHRHWFKRRRRRELPSFEAIVSTEALFAAAQQVQRGGPAAGIDHVQPQDVWNRDLSQIVGTLHKALLDRTYRPWPTRPHRERKSGGGWRTIQIPTFADRIVARSLTDALSPWWERIFSNQSFGFRPQRDIWKMLAAMEDTMSRQNSWVLAQDDIRGAFDFVVIEQVLEAH